jgi:hypothetical protein
MRIELAVAVSLLLLATGTSRADDARACVAKATEALPRISGLMVKKSRTRPVPAAIRATWQGQTRPIMVDLDTVVDGAAETYSYICALTKGAAFVRRVMD